MADTNSRAEALAKLQALGVKPDLNEAPHVEEKVTRSGDEVYAGGDEARILVRPAHLTYREGTDLLHAFASVGDTVLLAAKQAKRLDGLGVTASVDAEDLEAVAEGGIVTDDQLRAMTAADLIAHVAQNPEERGRVRALELERDEDKRRATVLKATAPEDEDGEEFDPEDEA